MGVLIAALTFDVQADRRFEFLSTVAVVARAIRRSAGCLGATVVTDCESPSRVTLFSEWTSPADLDRFLASAEFEILEGTRFLLHSGPRLSVDEVVSRRQPSETIRNL